MKSIFHIRTFLSNYAIPNQEDRDIIDSFLRGKHQIPLISLFKAPVIASNVLDGISFIRWYKSGLEPLKTAKLRNASVLLGNCTLEKAEIIASFAPGSTLRLLDEEVPVSLLSEASEAEKRALKEELLGNGLQPDHRTLRLVPRYHPASNSRTIFYDFSQTVRGTGVFREADSLGNVSFLCHYIYPDKAAGIPGRLACGSGEKSGINLRDYIFEDAEAPNRMTALGNTTSVARRLNKELEGAGKIWRSRLARIEPLRVEVAPGERYYFISDQLKVFTCAEKNTPVSHLRYLSGNYFTDLSAATMMAGRIKEMLRNYLASPGWPFISPEELEGF